MQRRDFLKAATFLLLGGGATTRALAAATGPAAARPPTMPGGESLVDYLERMRHFDAPHPGDVVLEGPRLALMRKTLRHLRRLYRTIGDGQFQLLDFNTALKEGRDWRARVGEFGRDEIDFLEELFYTDAARYGFLGDKPLRNITDCIRPNEVVKVPGSGSYLYRGRPLETFEKMRGDIPEGLVLTSGVRGVMKQFLLFLDKADANGANLSLASRSLAPPGFSFHGISDFDVGQHGFGKNNFTDRFVTTPVFARLCALEYVDLRYPRDNMLGVRFEPWHIKVRERA